MSPVVQDDEWVSVQRDVIAILDGWARQLRAVDDSLIWEVGGRQMAASWLSCWMTMSQRGAIDPHFEIDVKVTGEPGAMMLGVDIGTFDGDVRAEYAGETPLRTAAEITEQVRLFIDEHGDLVRSLATGITPL